MRDCADSVTQTEIRRPEVITHKHKQRKARDLYKRICVYMNIMRVFQGLPALEAAGEGSETLESC